MRCMCFPPDPTLKVLNTILGEEKDLALEAKGKGHLQLGGGGGVFCFKLIARSHEVTFE